MRNKMTTALCEIVKLRVVVEGKVSEVLREIRS